MTTFTRDIQHNVLIPADNAELNGLLHIPADAKGIVLFVHGSGSGRLSPRNQAVAKVLQQHQLGTLLFDLLTSDEEKIDVSNAQYRFDIDLLAERLNAATQWVLNNPMLKQLSIGYFGASTGAAAAFVVAAKLSSHVKAVVSRGGRPDLANDFLPEVQSESLLIVGSLDEQVIELNKQAMNRMRCHPKLEIIHGATHLFEEPGALEKVADLAQKWFVCHLV